MTSPDRWDRIQALFHEAIRLTPSERERFLEHAAGGDASLIAEVEALLEHDSAPSLIDREIGAVSSALLDTVLRPGTVVGAYRIEDVLGQGGMGVVYRATRIDLGIRVAIKMLRGAWISPDGRMRFEREQRTLARLEHPGIARILDASTLPDGAPYFVIEYVDGIPITEYCDRFAPSLADRLSLFRDVCAAVQFAHRNAIIHRDIKPSNILVTPDGVVKLLDFGIARQIEGIGASADPAATQGRLLTPAYAAPEQARGDAVGVFTDVYALGMLLYELVSGTTPFARPGRTPGEIEAAVLAERPERPGVVARRAASDSDRRIRPVVVGAGTWRDLDVVCLTAIQKDPANRYPSVEALVRDVDNLLAGRPLEARPEPIGRRAVKFVRRNARPLAATVVVLLTGIGLTAYFVDRVADENLRFRLEAEKSRQISEYLIGMFEAADPFSTDVVDDVQALVERGEEQVETLAAQPLVQAQFLDVLGRVWTRLSGYERADVLLNRALGLRREADPASIEVAETLTNLGVLYSHTGDYERAEEALREAVAIRERLLPANDVSVAEALDLLAVVLSDRGEYSTAIDLYRRALGIYREVHPEPHRDLGEILNNIAVNLYNQGRLEDAEDFYRQAIDNDRVVFGDDHPTMATNYANLARIHQDRGDYDRAERLLGDALDIRVRTLGADHFETAVGHSQIANLYISMDRLDLAETHHREALRIREALLGMDHTMVGTTLNGLALVQHLRGDFAAAESGFRGAIEIYSNTLGPRHRFTALATCNLATTLHGAHREAEAGTAFDSCLDVLETVHPPDHPELAYNLGRYGAYLIDRGRFAEAEHVLRRARESLLAAYGPQHEQTRQVTALLATATESVR